MSLSTVVLWSGEWNWDTPFLSIFPCHSLFYSSLPKNTSGVVKQLSKPRRLSKTWWSHETEIIGNELTFLLDSAPRMDSFFHYPALCWIRHNSGKSLCCVLWSFRQKHDNEPIPDSNPCQVTQPCTHLVCTHLGNDQNRGNILWGQIPYLSGTALFSSSGKRMGYSGSAHEPGHFLWSILLSIQNTFIMSVNEYIPIQSF